MSLALYMDEHVKSVVTSGLRRRGLDVLTVQEDGYAEQEDEQILERATELERVLFTQDEDFLAIAQAWQTSGLEFSGLVYGHQLDLTVGAAVNNLELVCQAVTSDEIRNTIIYLPL